MTACSGAQAQGGGLRPAINPGAGPNESRESATAMRSMLGRALHSTCRQHDFVFINIRPANYQKKMWYEQIAELILGRLNRLA